MGRAAKPVWSDADPHETLDPRNGRLGADCSKTPKGPCTFPSWVPFRTNIYRYRYGYTDIGIVLNIFFTTVFV